MVLRLTKRFLQRPGGGSLGAPRTFFFKGRWRNLLGAEKNPRGGKTVEAAAWSVGFEGPGSVVAERFRFVRLGAEPLDRQGQGLRVKVPEMS